MSDWDADYSAVLRDGQQVFICECGYEATGLSELAVHDERRHA